METRWYLFFFIPVKKGWLREKLLFLSLIKGKITVAIEIMQYPGMPFAGGERKVREETWQLPREMQKGPVERKSRPRKG